MKMMITLTYTMYIKQHDEYVRKKKLFIWFIYNVLSLMHLTNLSMIVIKTF